jgi:hypothetical protein
MRHTMDAGASKPAVNDGHLVERARRPEQLHAREARARYGRGLVAFTIFLMMLTAGLMIGTHAVISPAQKEAAAKKREREAKQAAERTTGWIVQELPDGLTCQYIKFDNVTERVGAPTLALCEEALRERIAGRPGFSWGRSH